MRTTLGSLLFSCALTACPADERQRPDSDASDAPGETDLALDTEDAADDGETADDTRPADSVADTADTMPADTLADTTPDDTAPDGTTVAVPGTRCELTERIGLVQIEDAATTPPSFYASALIEDRPSPWYGAPELATDACVFHRFAPAAPCPPCAEDELCGLDGLCVKAPLPFADARLTLFAPGQDPQVITDWAQVQLSGDTFSLEVTFADQRVTLGETSSPGALTDVSGTLEGGYEAPTNLDLAWHTSEAGSFVFTHIPINHHAAAPTFTECTVPATVGALHIGEAMLAPLAVITGLEFQGLEHVRFAAAKTPLGCVEIRFTVRQYVSF